MKEGKKDWPPLLSLSLSLLTMPPGSPPVSFSHSLLLASLEGLERSSLGLELEKKKKRKKREKKEEALESFLRLMKELMVLVEALDHA